MIVVRNAICFIFFLLLKFSYDVKRLKTDYIVYLEKKNISTICKQYVGLIWMCFYQ